MSLLFSSTFAQTKVDLGTIAKNNNAVKYVAIGSSLSAGVRDGGVYAEAQQTSFPALLAQQMGIKDFKQPLLEGNGTGHKTASLDKNGVLKFSEVKGLDDKSPNAQLPKVVGEVDNLAVPYQKLLDMDKENMDNALPQYERKSFPHFQRFVSKENEKKINFFSQFTQKVGNKDFFTFEFGFHDFVQYLNSGGYGTSISYMTDRESMIELQMLDILTGQKAKGVICNAPDVRDFPLYQNYSFEKISAVVGDQPIYISLWAGTATKKAENGDVFLQSSAIEKLLNGSYKSIDEGLSEENPILDKYVLTQAELNQANPFGYNSTLNTIAEKYDLPVVDLHKLYKQILNREFITNDGIFVDPTYPNGNFFSSDGVTPTAFGQAIITNEIIKTINDFYGAKIELLTTKTYLNN